MGNLNDWLDKVIEGDCLEILAELPAASINMILCDLPYGTTINPWDEIIPLQKLWELYKRIIKPNGAIVLTAAGLFTAKLISSNQHWFKYKIVWIKSKSTNFLNAKKQPLRRHEDICIFYNKHPPYFPQMISGLPYNKGWRREQLTGCYGKYHSTYAQSNGERYPYDILCLDDAPPDDWFYCKTSEHEQQVYHPTQKPVELVRYLIKTYSRPGDVILDNACGSGSFLVAAVLENRHFIGIEKNQNVFYKKDQPIDLIAVCRQRIQQTLEQSQQTSSL